MQARGIYDLTKNSHGDNRHEKHFSLIFAFEFRQDTINVIATTINHTNSKQAI